MNQVIAYCKKAGHLMVSSDSLICRQCHHIEVAEAVAAERKECAKIVEHWNGRVPDRCEIAAKDPRTRPEGAGEMNE